MTACGVVCYSTHEGSQPHHIAWARLRTQGGPAVPGREVVRSGTAHAENVPGREVSPAVSGVTVTHQNYRGGVRQAGAWGPNDQEQRPGEHPGAGEEERHAWAATADGLAPFGCVQGSGRGPALPRELHHLGMPPRPGRQEEPGAQGTGRGRNGSDLQFSCNTYSFLVTPGECRREGPRGERWHSP